MKQLKPYPVPYTKGGLMAGISDMGSQLVNRGFSIFENIRNTAVLRFFSSIKPVEKQSTDAETERKEEVEVTSMLTYLNPHARIDYAIQERFLRLI
jgi:hypothetical protein